MKGGEWGTYSERNEFRPMELMTVPFLRKSVLHKSWDPYLNDPALHICRFNIFAETLRSNANSQHALRWFLDKRWLSLHYQQKSRVVLDLSCLKKDTAWLRTKYFVVVDFRTIFFGKILRIARTTFESFQCM